MFLVCALMKKKKTNRTSANCNWGRFIRWYNNTKTLNFTVSFISKSYTRIEKTKHYPMMRQQKLRPRITAGRHDKNPSPLKRRTLINYIYNQLKLSEHFDIANSFRVNTNEQYNFQINRHRYYPIKIKCTCMRV